MIRFAPSALVLALLLGTTSCVAAAGADLSAEDQARLGEATRYVDDNSHLDHVEQVLLELERHAPGNPDVLYQLARVQVRLGRYSTRGRPGTVPEGLVERRITRAEEILDQVLATDPRHLGALLLQAHVKYLRHDFDASQALLDRASTVSPDSPHLAQNLADLRWAQALERSGDESQRQAALQPVIALYQKAIRGAIDSRREASVAVDLGDLHQEIGDMDAAERYYTQAIDAFGGGWDQANALHRRAMLRLYERKDVDAALADIERGRKVADFGVLRESHAMVLLIKAGTLCSPACGSQAEPLLRQLRDIDEDGGGPVDLRPMISDLGHFEGLRPGLRALVAAGVIPSWKDPAMGPTLTWLTMRKDTQDLAWLLEQGADPNVGDRELGTPLHSAIFQGNAALAMMLLDHGADPTIPYRDGRTPLAILEQKKSPEMAAVMERVRNHPAVLANRVALEEGRGYEAPTGLKLLYGDLQPPAGSTITYKGQCHLGDAEKACLDFRVYDPEPARGSPQEWTIWVGVPRDQLRAFASSLRPVKAQ